MPFLRKFTFSKQERLCRKKIIEQLFEKSKPFLSYPFRVFFEEAETESPFPVQVLLTVSKKNFRKASDRNLIKRRMKEAYRKNKHLLYESLGKENKRYALVLIYIAKDKMEYQEMERKLIATLQKITNYELRITPNDK